MIGFELDYHDNDSYAFRTGRPVTTKAAKIVQAVAPDFSTTPFPLVNRCIGCGELLRKWNEPLHGLVVKKRKYDISTTYDGVLFSNTGSSPVGSTWVVGWL